MNDQNNPQFSAGPEPQWWEEHHFNEARKAMQVVKKHLDAVTTRDARVKIMRMAEDAMLRSAQALISQTPYLPRLPNTQPRSAALPTRN